MRAYMPRHERRHRCIGVCVEASRVHWHSIFLELQQQMGCEGTPVLLAKAARPRAEELFFFIDRPVQDTGPNTGHPLTNTDLEYRCVARGFEARAFDVVYR